MLSNPIYKGVLRFNFKATDVVNDTRVQQKNPEAEVMFIPNFCEPIIPPDVFDRVQAIRQLRRDAMRVTREPVEEERALRPLGAGLALKYPLSGLVYCKHCGSRMTATTGCGRQRQGEAISILSLPSCNQRWLRELFLHTRGQAVGCCRRDTAPAIVSAA